MARYIDADKALKLIKEQKEKETGAYSKGRNMGLNIARSIINNAEVLPTADVVEVKHGEWIDTGDEILDTTYSGWKCSECGYVFCGNKLKFCPECGAKMDGEMKTE